MGKKIWLLAGCTASILALLAGCSSRPQPSQTPTSSVTTVPTTPPPTPSASPTATPPAQAASDFALAVAQSIDSATSSGLTQTVTNSTYGVYTLAMDKGVDPKYQAAIRNPDGTVEPVYDADSFAPYFAQELVAAHAPVSEVNHVFTVTKNIEGQNQDYVFVEVGHRLVSETMTDPSGVTVKSDLDYALGKDAQSILKTAAAAKN
jgi:hypothetical protein